MARRTGYHGREFKLIKGDNDCARCHTEHYGVNFSIIKWPVSKDEFDHRTTGYPLEGRHARLTCGQCHTERHMVESAKKLIAKRTLARSFMALTKECLSCHVDRHVGQLGADCQKCHDFSKWKPVATFDHSTTHYPLTGKHEDVQCEKCHQPLPDNPKAAQYTKLNFADCSGCHQDPHRGAFAARCESCHNTTGWRATSVTTSFDHSKTKFPLNGKHAGLACQKCHKTSNFKKEIAHEKCMDCHEDQHHGQFATRADHGECGACHVDKGFKPSPYNETNHKDTKFPLTAKHSGVACAKCHLPAGRETNYHPAFGGCLDCHKDPHASQFKAAPWDNRCDKCHTADGFHPSTFTISRHQSGGFTLKGAHAAVGCLDCHGVEGRPAGSDRRFRFAVTSCPECHRDPHLGEYPDKLKAAAKPADLCESCHTLRSWRQLNRFDHSTTNFELTGAHKALACTDCHRPRGEEGPRQIPFKSAAEHCSGCHEDIHTGQFDKNGQTADCSRCHITTRWAAANFDHEKSSTFSLAGAHANVPCRSCHVRRPAGEGRTVVKYRGTTKICKDCH